MQRLILEQLITWKNKKNRKPLILKGARQVGKTYVLKEFGEKYFDNYHYLNFEHNPELKEIFEKALDPKNILADISLRTQRKINKEQDLLILDEIQFAPKALTSLKYFCEMMPELTVCAAGSLLGLQLNQESFPVGKVDYLYMFPMSFEEFLLGIGDQMAYGLLESLTCLMADTKINSLISDSAHNHLWERLKTYFVTGGLPEVVQEYKENQDDLYAALSTVREKQQTLVSDYGSDIAKHSGKENSMHIERIWENIPLQLSNSQDGSSPRFVFKGAISGVKSYARMIGPIDWLLNAGLIIKLPIANRAEQPLPAFCKDNIFKLFIFDIGIAGALVKLSPKTFLDYGFGTYQGFFVENFVIQELKLLDAGIDNFYCWREGTAEIEFLREYNGKTIPIEVKSGWVTKSKSLSAFIQRYNPPIKVILSAKKLHLDKENKIAKLPLYAVGKFDKFLQNF